MINTSWDTSLTVLLRFTNLFILMTCILMDRHTAAMQQVGQELEGKRGKYFTFGFLADVVEVRDVRGWVDW